MTMAISWYHDIMISWYHDIIGILYILYIYIHGLFDYYESMIISVPQFNDHQTSLQRPASLVGVSAVAMAITEGHRLWVQWRPSSYRPVGDPETELSEKSGIPMRSPWDHHLVGGILTYPSEKSWTSSVGIMTFLNIPNRWKKNSHVPNHQPAMVVSISHGLIGMWGPPWQDLGHLQRNLLKTHLDVVSSLAWAEQAITGTVRPFSDGTWSSDIKQLA